jgi:imidazolonepropionase-like amidohydrolase
MISGAVAVGVSPNAKTGWCSPVGQDPVRRKVDPEPAAQQTNLEPIMFCSREPHDPEPTTLNSREVRDGGGPTPHRPADRARIPGRAAPSRRETRFTGGRTALTAGLRFTGGRTALTTRFMAALAAGLVVTSPAVVQAQTRGDVAFVNVSVIPMDRERVVRDQTVVVHDGRIATMGPAASTEVPAGAVRVDGQGRFLTPGIAELHGHIPAVGAQGSQFSEDALFLYVAAGATTVRGMQGHPTQFELRRRIEKGEIIGPRLVLGSPPLSGNNATDAATAERLVREFKSQGYDLLKVHEALPVDAYDAIVKTATELGLPWGGHVSDIVGLHRAIAAHQSTVDHLDNYVIELMRDPKGDLVPANVDEGRIPVLVKETKDAGVAVVPTMALWEVILGAHDPGRLMDREELRYMPSAMVRGWRQNLEARMAQVDGAQSKYELALRLKVLKALSDGGVRILMGTDAPQLFSVPGFSLDRELAVMARSGMTPFRILQSGTTAMAAHFGWTDVGTIAVGQRADLLLLDANPLEDIANLTRRAGVMLYGRWLPWSEIRTRLDAMSARNRAD